MFKKGRKREARGLAVVYFIIGLIILLIILAVIYFALVELDYSDQIKNPDATIRAYVEATPEAIDGVLADGEDDGFDTGLDVDLTEVVETPEPTPEPTPSPTPTATPEPTPSPTPFPAGLLAKIRTDNFTLPQAATNCQGTLTNCYVSVADGNRYMYLTGYAFINDANFDASLMKAYLIITESTTNKMTAYEMTMKPGISGVAHNGAVCQSPASSDFEGYIDVSGCVDGTYKTGVVIGYLPKGKKKPSYAYYELPANMTFTVQGGQVVVPIAVAGVPAVAGTAVAADPALAAAPEGADAAVDVNDASDVFGEAPITNPTANAAVTGTEAPVAPFDTPDPAVSMTDQLMAEQMITG